MQVRDLIEELKKFDPSCIVEVSGGGYRICPECDENIGKHFHGEVEAVGMAPHHYRVVIECE